LGANLPAPLIRSRGGSARLSYGAQWLAKRTAGFAGEAQAGILRYDRVWQVLPQAAECAVTVQFLALQVVPTH
jgi:hypothetical protein